MKLRIPGEVIVKRNVLFHIFTLLIQFIGSNNKMSEDEPEEVVKVMYPKTGKRNNSPSPTPSDEYNPEKVTPVPAVKPPAGGPAGGPGYGNAAPPPPPYHGYHAYSGSVPTQQKAWADYYARYGEYYKQYYAATTTATAAAAGGYYPGYGHPPGAMPTASAAPPPTPAAPPTGGVARKLGDAEPRAGSSPQDSPGQSYVPQPITVSPLKSYQSTAPAYTSTAPPNPKIPNASLTPAYSAYTPTQLRPSQPTRQHPRVVPQVSRDPNQVKFLVTEWVTKCIDLAKNKPPAVRTAVENAVRKEMPPQSHWGRIDWINKLIPESVLRAVASDGKDQRRRRRYSSDSSKQRNRGRRYRRQTSSSSSLDERKQKRKPAVSGTPTYFGQVTGGGSPPKGREFNAKQPRDNLTQLPSLRDVRNAKEKRKRRASSSSSSSSSSSDSIVVRRTQRGVINIDIPQPNSYAHHTALAIERSRTKDKKLQKQSKLQSQFSSLDNLGKREDRLARFERAGGKKTFQKPTNLTMTSNLSGGLGMGKSGNEFAEDECAPIIGICEDLEKTFTRSAAGLEHDPRDVRPEHVLRKSLQHICRVRLQKEGDDQRIYCYEQFKSLRQDLTVQHIYTSFTTEVYETHARLCLEHGDLGEFNACQAKLRAYHKRNDMIVSASNVREFTAYRILYCALTKSHADLSAEMENLSAVDRKDDVIRHALSIITALTPLNTYLLDKLYNNAPNLGAMLIDLFLPPPRGLRMQVWNLFFFFEKKTQKHKKK